MDLHVLQSALELEKGPTVSEAQAGRSKRLRGILPSCYSYLCAPVGNWNSFVPNEEALGRRRETVFRDMVVKPAKQVWSQGEEGALRYLAEDDGYLLLHRAES